MTGSFTIGLNYLCTIDDCDCYMYFPVAIMPLQSNSELTVLLVRTILLFTVIAFVVRLSKMRSNSIAVVWKSFFQRHPIVC